MTEQVSIYVKGLTQEQADAIMMNRVQGEDPEAPGTYFVSLRLGVADLPDEIRADKSLYTFQLST